MLPRAHRLAREVLPVRMPVVHQRLYCAGKTNNYRDIMLRGCGFQVRSAKFFSSHNAVDGVSDAVIWNEGWKNRISVNPRDSMENHKNNNRTFSEWGDNNNRYQESHSRASIVFKEAENQLKMLEEITVGCMTRSQVAHVRTMVETVHEEQQNASAAGEVMAKHRLALHAEALLRRLISEDIEGKNSFARPKAELYNKVIDTWRMSQHPEAGVSASSILHTVGEHYLGDMESTPDTETFNLVLDAYSRGTEGRITNAEKAHDDFSLMVELYKNGSFYVIPNTETFKHIIECWLNVIGTPTHHNVEGLMENEVNTSVSPDAGQINLDATNAVTKADDLLFKMELKESNVKPTMELYTKVLNAWIDLNRRFGNNPAFVDKAEAVLDRIHDQQQRNSYGPFAWNYSGDVKLSTQLVQNVILARIDSDEERNSIARSDELLQKMIRYSNDARYSTQIEVTKPFLQVILAAYARRSHREIARNNGVGGEDAARKATDILNFMVQLHHEDKMHLAPDTESFLHVLTAWEINRIHSDVEKHVDKLLSCMYTLESTGGGAEAGFRIDVPLLREFSRVYGELEKPKKVEKLLNRMVEQKEEMKHVGYQGGINDFADEYTVTDFRNAIQCWSKCIHCDISTSRAEGILHRLKKCYQAGGNSHAHLKPTAEIYSAVINTYLNNQKVNSCLVAQRAKEILDELYDDHHLQVDKTQSKLSNKLFNSVIMAHSKNGDAEQAEDTLNTMLKLYESDKNASLRPNHVVFTSAITAWAKSGNNDAGERAERLLHTLIDLSKHDPNIYPNTWCFVATITAWTNNGSSNTAVPAANRVEDLLDKMINLYHEGNHHLKPDTIVFTSVINAWAKSKDPKGPERAEEIFQKMHQLYSEGRNDLIKLDASVYTAALSALAKSRKIGAAEKAHSMLNYMITQHQTCAGASIAPERQSYGCVLEAYRQQSTNKLHDASRDDSPIKAEEVLNLMERNSHLYNDNSLVPDTLAYNAVIVCWANSNVTHKARRSLRVLRQMCERHAGGVKEARPELYSFNSVLNACAFSYNGDQDEKKQALQIAEETFRILRERRYDVAGGAPNSASYTYLLKCYSNLMPIGKKRDQACEDIFHQCCRDGQVNMGVLNALRKSSMKTFYRVIPDGRADVQKLPPKCSVNTYQGAGKKGKNA